MQSEYIAHRKEDTGEIQTVKAHSEETANYAESMRLTK